MHTHVYMCRHTLIQIFLKILWRKCVIVIFTQQTEALEHLFANIDVQQWARGSEGSRPIRLSYGLNITDGADQFQRVG